VRVPIATITEDPLLPLSVELKPTDAGAPDPRFTTGPFTLVGSRDLGTLNQAAFVLPNVYRFSVHGGASDGAVISGALVRASTTLPQDPTLGITDYLRDARTGADGSADLALLPGTATEPRPYAVAVVPPADSEFSILCLPAFPVGAGGTTGAPASVQAIALPRRATVNGTVLDASGDPVTGVVVVATRTTDDATPCASTAGSPPVSATTDDHGRFTLRLDPGTYQLDYDPPAGSPVPRLTASGVAIAGSDSIARTVQMRPGLLVEGDVAGPDGAPLPGAGLRLYELSCPSSNGCPGQALAPPVLRGQTRADAHGHFRAVISLPE
jgi:hypothetical protein